MKNANRAATLGFGAPPAPDAALLESALEQVIADDLFAAAALLVLPADAAPGIDFGFTDDALSYRGVAVRRGTSPVETALALYAAAAEAGLLEGARFRDLTADRLTWVGHYRSGTRLYTSGMWLLFALPDISVPAELEDVLGELVSEVVSRPHLPEVFAGRTTEIFTSAGPLPVAFPEDYASGFAVVFSDVVDPSLSRPLPARTPTFHLAEVGEVVDLTSPLSPAWTATDEVVSQLLEAFSPTPEVTVVPLESREKDVISAELVFEHAGFVCVLPVSSDGYAASIGVELPRHDPGDLPEVDLPDGFSLVGIDPFDGSYLASHDIGYVFALFPVSSTFPESPTTPEPPTAPDSSLEA